MMQLFHHLFDIYAKIISYFESLRSMIKVEMNNILAL